MYVLDTYVLRVGVGNRVGKIKMVKIKCGALRLHDDQAYLLEIGTSGTVIGVD